MKTLPYDKLIDPTNGLTKREYFASLFLTELLANFHQEIKRNNDLNAVAHMQSLAPTACLLAKILINELNKEENENI